ncbi:MAG: DUF551 domain-containing protein [Candidatus Ventricola sp.]
MGQALKLCKACRTPRDCDSCIDLHEWIMEHMEPQWISVKDKNPEKSRDENDDMIPYLTYIPGYRVGIGYYVQPFERWVRNGTFANVTHWMPMPEPPKEEQDT